MEIKVNLSKENLERLNKLAERCNASIDDVIELLIINETNLIESRELAKKYNEENRVEDYMEDTEEYEDNPFGDSEDDYDDWDF